MRFLKLTSLKLLVHDCRHLISPSLFFFVLSEWIHVLVWAGGSRRSAGVGAEGRVRAAGYVTMIITDTLSV